MAPRALLASLLFVSLAVVPAMSIDYMVGGDDKMWTVDFDYTEWAKDKTFYVGDRLVFMYTKGEHTVVKVNGTQFKDCVVLDKHAVLATGNDIITLATPGKKWYICGVGNHCLERKMKLVINVWPSIATPAPAPAPWPTTSAASGIGPNLFAFLIFGTLSLIMIKS